MSQDEDFGNLLQQMLLAGPTRATMDLERRKSYHKAIRFALKTGLELNLMADKAALGLLTLDEDRRTSQVLKKMSDEDLALFRVGCESILTAFKMMRTAVKGELVTRQYDTARERTFQMEMPEVPGFIELSVKEPELDPSHSNGGDA